MSMVPTDSVLKRHHEQMVGSGSSSASASSSGAAEQSPSDAPSESGSGCGFRKLLKKIFGG